MARRRDERPPPPLDKAALEAAALAYLERYASTAENLRRVLVRRVRTHAARTAAAASRAGIDADRGERAEGPDLIAVIDELVARYTSARLVDDDAFARGKAASLHRRGESVRGIRAKLHAKGVGDGDVRHALDALAEGSTSEQLDLDAAWRLARKRRLGPFREDAEVRAERREKDMAALIRRGFSYSIADRIVRTRPEDVP